MASATAAGPRRARPKGRVTAVVRAPDSARRERAPRSCAARSSSSGEFAGRDAFGQPAVQLRALAAHTRIRRPIEGRPRRARGRDAIDGGLTTSAMEHRRSLRRSSRPPVARDCGARGTLVGLADVPPAHRAHVPAAVGHELAASRAGRSLRLLAFEQAHGGSSSTIGWSAPRMTRRAHVPAWGLDPLFVSPGDDRVMLARDARGDVPGPARRPAQLGGVAHRVPGARAGTGDRERADPHRELLVLLAGVVATMGANLVLVRRAFAPLQRLTRLMHTVDPLAPGTRLHVDAGPREDVRELAEAFNAMLERLENERRDSARRAVARPGGRAPAGGARAARRARPVADRRAAADRRRRSARPRPADLEEAREGARRSLDDVRRIARDLRPDTLVELGLHERAQRAGHALHAPDAACPSTATSTRPARRSARTWRSCSTASRRRP